MTIDIEPGDRIMRPWTARFFLEAEGAPLAVKLDDPIAFRSRTGYANIGGPWVAPGRCSPPPPPPAERMHQHVPIEDVIASHQRAPICPNNLGADYERLGNATW